MTIEEILDNLKDDTTVYIGTMDGSGYFWIGSVEKAKESFEAMDKILSNLGKRDIANYEERLTSLEHSKPKKNWMKMKNSFGIMQLTEVDETEGHFNTRMKSYTKNLNKAKEKLARLKSYEKNLTDICHREVIEHGEKIEVSDFQYGPKYMILVEGFESGRWWFKSEFEKRHIQTREEALAEAHMKHHA